MPAGAIPKLPEPRPRRILQVKAEAETDASPSLLGVDPIGDLAQTETQSVTEPDLEAEVAPVIREAETIAVTQSGFVLVLEGLMYAAALAICLVLLFRFLPWVIVLWIMLPPVGVFGRRFCNRMLFLLTGGTVQAGT